MSTTQKTRSFGLTNFAVDNGTTILLVAVMILLFGLRSYRSMPKESFPEASLPTVYINTPYFGNSAAEIENLIARPIEKEIATITGVKDIKSTSIQDFSVILVQFEADVDQELAVRKIKDAVDKAKPELPDDLDVEPTVLEVVFSEFPIMTVNVSGNYSMDELRKYAEYLQDKIEGMREVNKVNLKGALDREVKINVDLFQMQSLQVSFMDIETAVAQENLSLSAGELVQNDFRRSIRVKGQFEKVEEIENLVVKSENERPIYLKDIAQVSYGFEERKSYARSNGASVIALDVVKRRGQNVIDAADKIKNLLEYEKRNLPPDISTKIFNDISVTTKESVATLENSIISGVILVVVVLLFFLGLRNAIFVGISIPLSMLLGILFLNITGVSLNFVVLFGLILALGLLVDNAIVVVENIYRYRQEGLAPADAAKRGAGEVAVPIIASTATTLAAFIPLALWPGIMGEFMKYFPITLMIVLSSSLLVALVINPVLTSRYMNIDERAPTIEGVRRKRKNAILGALGMLFLAGVFHLVGTIWLRNLLIIATGVAMVNFFLFRPGGLYFQSKILPAIEKKYDIFISATLKSFRPLVVFLSTIALLIGAIILLAVKTPPIEFFPSADPTYVNVFVDLPLGTDIESTNRVVKAIEEDVKRAIKPYERIVEEVLTQIGENTSDPMSPPEPGVTPHKARITTSFVTYKDRDGITTREVMNAIREEIKGYAGVSIVIDKNSEGPPIGKPINIELVGEDIDELAKVSSDIKAYLDRKQIPGVEELILDVQLKKPELEIKIDREAARRYGLSTAQIASNIRTSVFGKEVSKFKQGEDEYPIVVRLDEKYRYDINALINQKITFRDQARQGRMLQIPISAVASFEYKTSYSSIKRLDQKRVITIYSNAIDGYNANQIVEEMKIAMAAYDMPLTITYAFTGQQQQQAEDMEFLNGAFLVAIFTIFIILVSQFNSIYSPIIIILTVFFSTIGVFLGYAITGKSIVVIFSGVGIISLAGIVVNNAIVLVDYINLLVQRKREALGIDHMLDMDSEDIRAAIIEGGGTRLRPVLLTAITTVLGLIPLATGFNFDFFTLVSRFDPQIYIGGDTTALWGPLAWTVIYGLVFATFLTLIVVPNMYWLFYKLKFMIERKIFKGSKHVNIAIDEQGEN